jgi:hypothetical protein
MLRVLLKMAESRSMTTCARSRVASALLHAHVCGPRTLDDSRRPPRHGARSRGSDSPNLNLVGLGGRERRHGRSHESDD